jgi:hypothetical protein
MTKIRVTINCFHWLLITLDIGAIEIPKKRVTINYFLLTTDNTGHWCCRERDGLWSRCEELRAALAAATTEREELAGKVSSEESPP